MPGLGLGLGLSRGGGVRAASGPVAPADAAFAVIAHPAYTTTDTAGGTPCGDGDAIRWWKDAVTGTWYEQATSGARLILRADGGKWYAEGGAGRCLTWVTGVGRQSVTFGVSIRHSVSAVTHQMWLSDGFGLREYRTSGAGGASDKQQLPINGGGTLLTGGTTLSTPTDLRLIAVGAGGGTSRLYRDGVNDGSSADTTTAGTVDLTLGGRGSSFSMLGRYYGVAVYTSALDAGGVATLDTWLASLLP